MLTTVEKSAAFPSMYFLVMAGPSEVKYEQYRFFEASRIEASDSLMALLAGASAPSAHQALQSHVRRRESDSPVSRRSLGRDGPVTGDRLATLSIVGTPRTDA